MVLMRFFNVITKYRISAGNQIIKVNKVAWKATLGQCVKNVILLDKYGIIKGLGNLFLAMSVTNVAAKLIKYYLQHLQDLLFSYIYSLAYFSLWVDIFIILDAVI